MISTLNKGDKMELSRVKERNHREWFYRFLKWAKSLGLPINLYEKTSDKRDRRIRRIAYITLALIVFCTIASTNPIIIGLRYVVPISYMIMAVRDVDYIPFILGIFLIPAML